MRDIVTVMADCRHTHSERRFEEGNDPFRTNGRRITRIQHWEQGHGRTVAKQYTLGQCLSGGRILSNTRYGA